MFGGGYAHGKSGPARWAANDFVLVSADLSGCVAATRQRWTARGYMGVQKCLGAACMLPAALDAGKRRLKQDGVPGIAIACPPWCAAIAAQPRSVAPPST